MSLLLSPKEICRTTWVSRFVSRTSSGATFAFMIPEIRCKALSLDATLLFTGVASVVFPVVHFKSWHFSIRPIATAMTEY